MSEDSNELKEKLKTGQRRHGSKESEPTYLSFAELYKEFCDAYLEGIKKLIEPCGEVLVRYIRNPSHPDVERVYFDLSVLVNLIDRRECPLGHQLWRSCSKLLDMVDFGECVGMTGPYNLDEISYLIRSPEKKLRGGNRGVREKILEGYKELLLPRLNIILAKEVPHLQKVVEEDAEDRIQLEAAVALGCDAIVTYDKDFLRISSEIDVYPPEALIPEAWIPFDFSTCDSCGYYENKVKKFLMSNIMVDF